MVGPGTVSELDQLAAEAAAEAPKQPPPPPGGATAGPEQPFGRAQLVFLFGQLVSGLGNAICRRAGVPDLLPEEITGISEAAANVADHYDLSKLPPRTVAWLSLGTAVTMVALPRLELIQARDEAIEPEGEGPERDGLDQAKSA